MRAWDAARSIKSATADLAARRRLATARRRRRTRRSSHIVVVAEGSPVAELRAAMSARRSTGRAPHRSAGSAAAGDPWDDFLARPADYFAMLSELGFLTEDEEKSHGDLPDEIIEAVRDARTRHRAPDGVAARLPELRRPLRPRAAQGDHRRRDGPREDRRGARRARPPAGQGRAPLPGGLPGRGRDQLGPRGQLQVDAARPPAPRTRARRRAARNWIRNGGVAVTTFETLAWFEGRSRTRRDLGCVVVDEAHYIKNPDALRTQRTARLIDSRDRAILLTGTPLENRIEEFRNLVGYLRPDLVVDANELAPRRFRRQVAPAYLRRNQEDVLTELPELVEVDEWLPMSADGRSRLPRRGRGGQLHGDAPGGHAARARKSEKMQRLIEIVEEAEDNGRRVIVFSHFREVLDQVARSLPGQVFGPLTGSVPAATRQAMVDQFSAAGHGAVLVAQIVAGGVGLNIQAASVVVICEPQLKPTTEWQAIARAHRMGQLRIGAGPPTAVRGRRRPADHRSRPQERAVRRVRPGQRDGRQRARSLRHLRGRARA